MEETTELDLSLYRALLEYIEESNSAMVAYSGGVDSTLLSFATHQALGPKSLMVTAISPSFPRKDRERAAQIAQTLGWNHRELQTDEIFDENYRKNHSDRCFYCKFELFDKMKSLARSQGYQTLFYGAIPEDQDDHRPGNKAAQLLQVKAPLAKFGLDKQAIRRLSKHFGLPTWNLPASACLASRISYFSEVTEEKLSRVEQAEDYLKELGFPKLRVRHHEMIARVEIPPEDFSRFLERRLELDSHLKSLGFVYVTLDLGGLRSGSMNDVLKLRVLS